MDQKSFREYYCYKMGVSEIHMLRLMSGHTLNDATRNRDIIKGSDNKTESFKVFMTVCWRTGNEDWKVRGFKKSEEN